MNYISLRQQKVQEKKLMGVKFDIEKISLTGSLNLMDIENNIIGEL